jgi:hypothetical protein
MISSRRVSPSSAKARMSSLRAPIAAEFGGEGRHPVRRLEDQVVERDEANLHREALRMGDEPLMCVHELLVEDVPGGA